MTICVWFIWVYEFGLEHIQKNTYVQGDICSHTELLSFYICTIVQYNYLCTCISCLGFFGASGDLPRLLCKVVDVVGKDGSLFKLACPYRILNSLYASVFLHLHDCAVQLPLYLHLLQDNEKLACLAAAWREMGVSTVCV
jgi:hypothetical protein